jgi:hypothetical protein
MADEQPKYRGIPVFLDGRELIVPALSVRQFRDNIGLLVEPIGEVKPENVAERIGKFMPIIGMALRRNYPDLTDDTLLDMIDLDSFPEIIRAVQAASGMKAVRPGEAQPAAARSTGAGSTAQ